MIVLIEIGAADAFERYPRAAGEAQGVEGELQRGVSIRGGFGLVVHDVYSFSPDLQYVYVSGDWKFVR